MRNKLTALELKYSNVPYFLDFFSQVLLIFSACEDTGTIRGQEQNEGGVNITRQRMPSRVPARVRSVLFDALFDTRSLWLLAMSEDV